MKEFASLLPLVGIVLLFWLLVIRPAGRRNRELAHLQASVQPGDRVMLTSGIYGTVRTLQDDVLEVEIAEGVSVQVARGALGRLVTERADDVQES